MTDSIPPHSKDIERAVIGAMLIEVRRSLDLKRKCITEEIRDWVLLQDGYFFVTDCYKDMNLVTQSNKIACRVALKRLVEEGVIEHHGPRRGCYRRALNDCPALDWRNAPCPERPIR